MDQRRDKVTNCRIETVAERRAVEGFLPKRRMPHRAVPPERSRHDYLFIVEDARAAVTPEGANQASAENLWTSRQSLIRATELCLNPTTSMASSSVCPPLQNSGAAHAAGGTRAV